MVADYPIPKNGAAYVFYTGLIDQSNTKLLKASPTLAAGDFKVSIDGGAFANLATLPTVTPAGGTAVKISLSAGEMTGDNITIACIDAAGAEWCDQLINIQTAVRGVADLAFPATSGRSLVIDSAGLADANVVKIGPTGAGTAQTARDLGASVLLAAGTGAGQLDFTGGVVKANLSQILGTALTEGAAGRLKAAWTTFFDVAAPVLTTASVNQTGDNYARVGAPAGASVSADIAAVKASVGSPQQAGSAVILPANPPTDFLNAAAVKADAVTKIQAGLSTYAGGDTAGTGTLLTRIPGVVQPQTGDAYARLGAPAGASIAADIAEVEAETDDIAGVKAKTDQLTFTTALHVDATATVDTAAIAAAVIAGLGAQADPLLNTVPGTYPSGSAGAALGRVGSAQVTVVSPVSAAGDRVELKRGDDYLAADGRALDFSSDDWPDLTGAAVIFALHGSSYSGSVVTAGSGTQTVRWAPTAAVTSTLRSGTVYAVATLANGDVVTLLSARADVS